MLTCTPTTTMDSGVASLPIDGRSAEKEPGALVVHERYSSCHLDRRMATEVCGFSKMDASRTQQDLCLPSARRV